jgi:hypothetical protein
MDSEQAKIEISDTDRKVLSDIEDVHKVFHVLLSKFFDYCTQLKIVCDSSPRDMAINLLYAKAIKTYYAIYTLSKEGYGGDALIIIRSMLDIKINMKYIWNSNPSVANRFFDYEIYSQYKYINSRLEEDPNYIKLNNKRLFDFDAVSKGAEQFIKKYAKGKSHQWSGKTTKEMIELLPEEDKEEEKMVYKSLYRITSTFVHSNIIALKHYISSSGAFIIAPDTLHINRAYRVAVLLVNEIILLWQKHNNVPITPEIDQQFTNFNRYFLSKFFDM